MTGSFDTLALEYDRWFDRHPEFYRSELEAVKSLMPQKPFRSLEIGAGTGRFGSLLGIQEGVEISKPMGAMAERRGMKITYASAESLPFEAGIFDLALMVTTLCFIHHPQAALKEAVRVLKPGGSLIAAMVNRESPLGKIYLEKQNQSPFYKEAVFYTPQEVISLMKQAGFQHFETRQTLFQIHPEQFELSKPGSDEGSFVVIRGNLKP